MANTNVKIVFGGGAFRNRAEIDNMSEFLNVIEELKIDHIDTGSRYEDSEELLGQSDAASRFVIDTKYSDGVYPTPSSRTSIVKTGEASLKKLNTKAVDVFYLNFPDPRVPLEELLSGVNELYKSGAFKRFGLSNFTGEGVEAVVSHAKAQGYVLPTVYQGNYNAFSRHTEIEIFPVLRKHNIAFYAYSPSAGGFLTKSSDKIRRGGTGRWDPKSMGGMLYNGMYNKPALLNGLDSWNEIAKDAGLSTAEMAYRWIAHHSKLQGEQGDAVIVGAQTPEHLRETVAGIQKGPLSANVVEQIDALWDMIAADAPLDNYNSYIIKQGTAACNSSSAADTACNSIVVIEDRNLTISKASPSDCNVDVTNTVPTLRQIAV